MNTVLVRSIYRYVLPFLGTRLLLSWLCLSLRPPLPLVPRSAALLLKA